jgi:hypothetical protein
MRKGGNMRVPKSMTWFAVELRVGEKKVEMHWARSDEQRSDGRICVGS